MKGGGGARSLSVFFESSMELEISRNFSGILNDFRGFLRFLNSMPMHNIENVITKQ